MERCTFLRDQQRHQLAYFERHLSEYSGHLGRPFQLRPEFRLHGLLPGIRPVAERLFHPELLDIQWHPFIGHGRSSQACCLNFMMPLANRPDLLRAWIEHTLDEEIAEVLPIEQPEAAPHHFVAFEYTGPSGTDFLGEGGGKALKRGAHATAADAAVAFIDADGRENLLLIEWKYTEQYRTHSLSPDRTGKRRKRYADKMFYPNGPLRNDMGLKFEDFLFEPFYQLVRQQMLAWQIESAADCGVERARVLHLSPSGNRALHHVTSQGISDALTATTGQRATDAFEAYESCLVRRDTFKAMSIEDSFGLLASGRQQADWYPELKARYPSLCPG